MKIEDFLNEKIKKYGSEEEYTLAIIESKEEERELFEYVHNLTDDPIINAIFSAILMVTLESTRESYNELKENCKFDAEKKYC